MVVFGFGFDRWLMFGEVAALIITQPRPPPSLPTPISRNSSVVFWIVIFVGGSGMERKKVLLLRWGYWEVSNWSVLGLNIQLSGHQP